MQLRILVVVHALLSLAGLVVHLNLHPPLGSLYFWWAAPMDILSLTLLPILFLRPATVGWGCLVNAFTVLVGTIGMGYFAWLNPPEPFTWLHLLTRSSLPAILVLLVKLPLAGAIFRISQRAQRFGRGGAS